MRACISSSLQQDGQVRHRLIVLCCEAVDEGSVPAIVLRKLEIWVAAGPRDPHVRGGRTLNLPFLGKDSSRNGLEPTCFLMYLPVSMLWSNPKLKEPTVSSQASLAG